MLPLPTITMNNLSNEPLIQFILHLRCICMRARLVAVIHAVDVLRFLFLCCVGFCWHTFGQTIKPIHVFTFHSIVFIALMVYTIFFSLAFVVVVSAAAIVADLHFCIQFFFFSLIFATDSLFVIPNCYLHTKEKHFSSSCQMDNVRLALHNA